MDGTLSFCTKQMRGLTGLLFAEGVKSVEIIRRMQAQYGGNYLWHSKISE
jgi:hypothetical protein